MYVIKIPIYRFKGKNLGKLIYSKYMRIVAKEEKTCEWGQGMTRKSDRCIVEYMDLAWTSEDNEKR